MSDYSVINHDWEQTVTGFDTRADADDKRSSALQSFNIAPDDIEVVEGHYEDYAAWENSDVSSDNVDADVIDHSPDGGEVPVPEEPPQQPKPTETAVADVQNKDISEDPLNVMPGHFVDTIQGVPTINRKGYAVLAEHYGISVTAEPVTLPSETDFEYAEFRAVATTEDGTEYSGFGSAHVDRQDGDDPHLLAELAETRAMKRATAWATGVGITAKSEMENSL